MRPARGPTHTTPHLCGSHLCLHPLQTYDGEHYRLARPRLGLHDEVGPHAPQRDGGLLHGRGALEAGCRQCRHRGRGQQQVAERPRVADHILCAVPLHAHAACARVANVDLNE